MESALLYRHSSRPKPQAFWLKKDSMAFSDTISDISPLFPNALYIQDSPLSLHFTFWEFMFKQHTAFRKKIRMH